MKALILTLALIAFAVSAAHAGGDSNALGTFRIMKQQQIQQQKAAGDLITNPGAQNQPGNPAAPPAPGWSVYDPDDPKHWDSPQP